MAILTYELRAVGEADIARSLASVERRFTAHAMKINRTLAVGAGSVRMRQNPEAAVRSAAQSVARGAAMADRGIRSEERARIAAERNVARARESLDRQRSRALFQQYKQDEAAAERAARSWRRGITGGATKGVGALAAVGKAGLATLGVGGSVLAASSVTEALKLDEMTRRLVINARGPGEAGKDPGALRKKIVGAGLETGIAPEQIAQGALAFVGKTGDLDTAEQNLKNFALVAQATGSSVEDVAKTAAALTQNFDIKSTKDMGDALAVLAYQGKKGAFELKNMAEEFPELGGAAQRIGLKGVGGMRTLGGLAQIAQRGTGGDGANASTSLQAMFTQLTAKAGELHSGQALGGKRVDVFQGGDPTKAGRDIPTVLAEIISRSHGNQTQLTKLFDIRGMKAASPLINEYHRAADAAKGTDKQKEKAGYDAIIAMIKDAAETSGKFADVQKDAADVAQASSIQLANALEELEQTAAGELMPVVKDLIPHVKELAPVVRDVTSGLVDLAKFAGEHPFAGIGAVIAASITTEVAKAQISQIVAAQMTPGFMAAGTSALKFAGAAALAGAAVYAAVDQNDQLKKVSGGLGIFDLAGGLLEGKGIMEQIDEKQNADAKEEAARRASANPVGVALNAPSAVQYASTGSPAGAVGPDGIVMSPAAPPVPGTAGRNGAAGVTAKVEGGAELQKAANALQDAAAALKNGSPTTLNRGNAPSPVKG